MSTARTTANQLRMRGTAALVVCSMYAAMKTINARITV